MSCLNHNMLKNNFQKIIYLEMKIAETFKTPFFTILKNGQKLYVVNIIASRILDMLKCLVNILFIF